jgi:hypothetical protein
MNGRELAVGAVDELHDFDVTSPIDGVVGMADQ